MDNFGSILNSFAATASNVYGTLQQGKNTPAAAPTTVTVNATSTPAWQKYLPWGIGAVVLLIALGMFTRK